MKKYLREAIFNAIKQYWSETALEKAAIKISYPPPEQGDYTCNIALRLGKQLRQNPLEIAKKIAQTIEKTELKELKNLKKVEAVAPGFLNFCLSENYFQDQVAKINQQGKSFGNCQLGKGKKVHLDFVSANPTGPVHLGNARGGPYGDALANILEKAGYQTWREYYVNDFGNQIKILGHSVLRDDEAQYQGEYIDQLHQENRLSDPFEAGQWAAQKIIKEIIRPSMEKLGIKFDQYFSEKTLHTTGKVEDVLNRLREQDLVYEKDGAWWFRATKFGDEKDRVVKKTTGEITYFGGDIAYHWSKVERGFDKIIDIWGADHHGDIKRMLGVMEALGQRSKVEILLTQFVSVIQDSREVKMSKRQGTYISINDLLAEVGKDAIRFFFLMYANNSHITFDVDLAKKQSNQNPVYYVQYAHARICSILRKQSALGEEIEEIEADYQLLTHSKELRLMRHLERFPNLIESIAITYEVHRLPHYLIELADKLHSFYHQCQVLDQKNPALTLARVELVKAAKTVLAEGLRLLGVEAPERM